MVILEDNRWRTGYPININTASSIMAVYQPHGRRSEMIDQRYDWVATISCVFRAALYNRAVTFSNGIWMKAEFRFIQNHSLGMADGHSNVARQVKRRVPSDMGGVLKRALVSPFRPCQLNNGSVPNAWVPSRKLRTCPSI